jgi:ankyrin repeat protein
MNYINKQNNKGFTPLHYAAYKGNMKIILLLLKNNADIKIRNKSGLNMIHIASQANKSTPIYYLNQTYGFDLMDRDKNGNTPLH